METTIGSPAPELLTHSRSTCAAKCLRMHLLRYEIGLQRTETRETLHYGTLYHWCLEQQANGVSDQAIADHVRKHAMNPHLAESVLRMWMGHRWYYQDTGLDVVANEASFDVPIRNPETGEESKAWRNAGKRDKIVRTPNGRLALLEYKTTSSDISATSDYWAALRLDGQVSRYMLSARTEGFNLATVLYDVTRKPSIRPLLATPEESRRITKAGKLDARQRYFDETPDEYGERVAAAIAEDPARFYMRVEIARTDDDLAEFEQELWHQSQLLSDCKRHGRWFRNPASCLEPYRCDYLAICAEPGLVDRVKSGFLPAGFIVADKHPELAAPVGE